MAAHQDASHRVFPPLELKRSHRQIFPQQDHSSVLRTGHVQRELEAWRDAISSSRLTAHCVVNKGQRSIHRSDAQNMMGRCVWSMRLASLTVARVLYAPTAKGMAPPPKNRVGSARSCIPCHRDYQRSNRPRAFVSLALILSCGEIGHAPSLVVTGSTGNAVTWSLWKVSHHHSAVHRLRRSHALSERIGG